MSNNPVVYWEIASHYADKTVEFLNKLFDWKFEYDEKIGIYDTRQIETDKLVGGGVFTLRKAKLPFLTMYIKVDDIDAKAKKVVELGGYIVEAPFNVTERSRICLFNEPSGVTLAMIQTMDEK